MSTFAEDIEAAAEGELIEAIVVAGHRHAPSSWQEEVPRSTPEGVLSWAEARPILDYEYDGGFGSSDCHPIYAWTATRVLFVVEYDGSTSVVSVPRHPVAEDPVYP